MSHRREHPARWATALGVAAALVAAVHARETAAPPAPWPPPQLELRVPFEPTAFPSGGRTYLTYELHLRNFAAPLTLRRIEVMSADVDTETAEPIAVFDADELDHMLQPVGAQEPVGPGADRRQLAAGGSLVAFLWIALDREVRVPDALRHRVVTDSFSAEGAVVGTHHTRLRVFGPPLKGAHWLARSGPSNDSYHRRGLLIINGSAVIDRRYAIDWVQVDHGATSSGDALDNRLYHAYGAQVFAVADGRVVSVTDGVPENVPRHEGFRPAVPLSFDTLAGNSITLDVGDRQFALYAHLQPGSLRVKAGDRVRRGQPLARVGNSGDSREPHLHFEVTTSPDLLAGEGVPYVIDQYRVQSGADPSALRHRELPLKDTLIDFSAGAATK
jgi:hypothetical protein